MEPTTSRNYCRDNDRSQSVSSVRRFQIRQTSRGNYGISRDCCSCQRTVLQILVNSTEDAQRQTGWRRDRDDRERSLWQRMEVSFQFRPCSKWFFIPIE